jgi:hypothetical protein
VEPIKKSPEIVKSEAVDRPGNRNQINAESINSSSNFEKILNGQAVSAEDIQREEQARKTSEANKVQKTESIAQNRKEKQTPLKNDVVEEMSEGLNKISEGLPQSAESLDKQNIRDAVSKQVVDELSSKAQKSIDSVSQGATQESISIKREAAQAAVNENLAKEAVQKRNFDSSDKLTPESIDIGNDRRAEISKGVVEGLSSRGQRERNEQAFKETKDKVSDVLSPQQEQQKEQMLSALAEGRKKAIERYPALEDVIKLRYKAGEVANKNGWSDKLKKEFQNGIVDKSLNAMVKGHQLKTDNVIESQDKIQKNIQQKQGEVDELLKGKDMDRQLQNQQGMARG